MGPFAPLTPHVVVAAPPPAILRRDAPVPRVAERMKDVRTFCVAPAPAPPLSAAACLEALDELEREVNHERYLHARTVFRMRCFTGIERCDGERSA